MIGELSMNLVESLALFGAVALSMNLISKRDPDG